MMKKKRNAPLTPDEAQARGVWRVRKKANLKRKNKVHQHAESTRYQGSGGEGAESAKRFVSSTATHLKVSTLVDF